MSLEEQVVAVGWIVGLVILVLIAVVIARRAMQVTKLAHDGAAAEGTVIKKFRSGSGKGMAAPCLRYEYLGPNGQRYENKIVTSEAFWEAHEVGDKIEIVYARSKPSISGAKEMVNQSREALKLPPL